MSRNLTLDTWLHQGEWSFRVKICPKARSPKVTHPPSFWIDLWKIGYGRILSLSDHGPYAEQ